tara:strand:+ start:100 stop:1407 length:1308 start_codon:yes stop_codon:yes gene_type:complete
MDLKNRILKLLVDHLAIREEYASIAFMTIATLVILLVAWLSNFLVKRFVLNFIRSLTEKTKTKTGKYLLEEKFFHRLAHLAPAFVIGSLSSLCFSGGTNAEVVEATSVNSSLGFSLLSLIDTLVNLYLVFIGLWVIDAIINTGLKLYQHSKLSTKLPLKGICQAIKIVINASGLIFILSILLDKSPLYFFSGLGALTAVLLLVFKDAILGLVAGIQLSVNNMIRPGDWIEMPKYGADGDVVEVSLTTVKVQNFDKTITSIPAHALVSDAFKNWRGMSESGGRRIKRSIFIDISSIRFLDSVKINELRKIELLKEYLNTKLEDIGEAKGVKNGQSSLNQRNLTNVGTFRAYCLAYLRASPSIHQNGMTLLVRQLAPTEKGVPIEIYVFVNDTRWVQYEGIQGDIFDHLLASLVTFDLRAFQFPSDSSLSNVNPASS